MVLNRIVQFSVDHPRKVIVLTVAVTLAFAAQLPKASFDTDPKHMLPVTAPVRRYNDQVEKEFSLHADVIAVGIVNPSGIVNSDSLTRIAALTRKVQEIPGVIVRDVVSLATIDDVASRGGEVVVRPVLQQALGSQEEARALRDSVLANPLFLGRIVSRDATATAIYVPIEPAANGKEIADAIRRLLPKDASGDRYYVAGDPVARDTFGSEMFRQMALFSPVAGLLMCIALWVMFRSAALIVGNMAVAMISIVWCMGLLVGLRFPVHIMSSMSPVFLMAIATDSVHIFNEFAFRFGELRDKRRAVLDTMAAVGRPVLLSDLTTAAGFASLATASIVPVKIFGLFVGFGTLVILLMSFTLLPAILVLLREERIPVVRRVEARVGDRRSLALAASSPCGRARADETSPPAPSFHGFLLAEAAGRTTGQRPPGGDGGDFVLGEERLRLELSGGAGGALFLGKGELVHDAVANQFAVDLREGYVSYAVGPADFRLGRMIVTWGVGDLFFINDVFPKDWESFFSGRPLEYLKLGVDGVQVRFSTPVVDGELLAIPFFTPDTLPSPLRFSSFFPYAGVPGQREELPPSRFSNTELAVRLYRQVEGFDISLYAYRGFWRTPSVRLDDPVAPTVATRFFPELSTYGASVQRNLFEGALSVEAGYYDSRQDRSGADPTIPNSQWRFLAGYQRELWPDFTAGLQLYAEVMANYAAYVSSLPAGAPRQDEFRGVLSLRLTWLLDYQAWRLSVFVAYSSTDEDYFVQPEVSYKVTDAFSLRAGANVLGGRHDWTFFGQLARNDNVFVAGRMDF